MSRQLVMKFTLQLFGPREVKRADMLARMVVEQGAIPDFSSSRSTGRDV